MDASCHGVSVFHARADVMSETSTLWDLASNQVSYDAIRLAISGTLAFAGGLKLVRPDLIAATLVRSGMGFRRPQRVGRSFGAVEIATAVGVLLPPMALVGAMAAGLLSIVFAAFIGRGLYLGADYPCACLGNPTKPISASTLARPLLLGLGSGVVIAVGFRGPASWASLQRSLVLVSIGASVPILFSALTAIANTRRHLDSELDWTWILQRVNAEPYDGPIS